MRSLAFLFRLPFSQVEQVAQIVNQVWTFWSSLAGETVGQCQVNSFPLSLPISPFPSFSAVIHSISGAIVTLENE